MTPTQRRRNGLLLRWTATVGAGVAVAIVVTVVTYGFAADRRIHANSHCIDTNKEELENYRLAVKESVHDLKTHIAEVRSNSVNMDAIQSRKLDGIGNTLTDIKVAIGSIEAKIDKANGGP